VTIEKHEPMGNGARENYGLESSLSLQSLMGKIIIKGTGNLKTYI